MSEIKKLHCNIQKYNEFYSKHHFAFCLAIIKNWDTSDIKFDYKFIGLDEWDNFTKYFANHFDNKSCNAVFDEEDLSVYITLQNFPECYKGREFFEYTLLDKLYGKELLQDLKRAVRSQLYLLCTSYYKDKFDIMIYKLWLANHDITDCEWLHKDIMLKFSIKSDKVLKQ